MIRNLAIILIISAYTLPARCNQRVNLSCGQIRAFVDGHNFRRLTVAQGAVPGQPAASNMMYMIWDEELAEKAAKWAENGVFGHNPDRNIGSQRWSLVGENIYFSNFYATFDCTVIPNIEEALNSWFNEHFDYGFFPFVLGTPKQIGHYTQMVWANSNRVGCGISQRKESGTTFTLFVCNYGPNGNFLSQLPYKPSFLPGFLQCNPGECSKPYGQFCSSELANNKRIVLCGDARCKPRGIFPIQCRERACYE